MLLGGYAAYVFVCATFKPLVRIFCPISDNADEADFYVDFYADESVELPDELPALNDGTGGIIGTPTAAAVKEAQTSGLQGFGAVGGASLSEGLLKQGQSYHLAFPALVRSFTLAPARFR